MDSEELPKKVELGCGMEKQTDFLGVDVVDTEQVDLVIDLDEVPWSLPSDHFEVIRAIDVFEHLDNPIAFMEEVHRIATPDAKVVIRSPHLSSDNWHDPTHKRLTGSRTFEHFTNESRFQFYTDATFEVIDFEITFEWTQMWLLRVLGHYIANRNPWVYERTLLKNLFPATNIRFELSPLK